LKGIAIAEALAAYLSIDRVSLGAAEVLLAEALLAAALTPAMFSVLAWEKRVLGVE
jgi:uncharacterized MnhB-related membrane protein